MTPPPTPRFPQHYAAASLKRGVEVVALWLLRLFSAALRCGLIEAPAERSATPPAFAFSAALRCGLIEAGKCQCHPVRDARFPQHYAAASLKHWCISITLVMAGRFPQHYAAASLKPIWCEFNHPRLKCFPQHYAAASLKLPRDGWLPTPCGRFSAALRCGLIEASRPRFQREITKMFSAATRQGSAKHEAGSPR